MKKIILILMAYFVIVNCQSQTEKGKMFIGGNMSLSGYTNSHYVFDTIQYSDKSSNFYFLPNFAYFIKDNLAIGGNLSFQKNNSNRDNTGTSQGYYNSYKFISTYYGIGFFARYYKKIAGSFSFYLNGNLGYSYGIIKKTYTDQPDQLSHSNSISIGISPGLVYFISPKLGIQTSIGSLSADYSSLRNINTPYEDTHSNSFNYGLTFNLSSFLIGINYYF